MKVSTRATSRQPTTAPFSRDDVKQRTPSNRLKQMREWKLAMLQGLILILFNHRVSSNTDRCFPFVFGWLPEKTRIPKTWLPGKKQCLVSGKQLGPQNSQKIKRPRRMDIKASPRPPFRLKRRFSEKIRTLGQNGHGSFPAMRLPPFPRPSRIVGQDEQQGLGDGLAP